MKYKKYDIKPAECSSYEIKPIGKGSVHSSLRGLYTSRSEAMKAIDLLESAKESSRATNKSTS